MKYISYMKYMKYMKYVSHIIYIFQQGFRVLPAFPDSQATRRCESGGKERVPWRQRWLLVGPPPRFQRKTIVDGTMEGKSFQKTHQLDHALADSDSSHLKAKWVN